MTYSGYIKSKNRRNSQVNKVIFMNLIFTITVLVVFMDSWENRVILIGVLSTLLVVLTPLISKSIRQNRNNKDALIKQYADIEIVAKADNYFGSFSIEKFGQALLLLIYFFILMACITIVYRVLEMPILVIFIVDALHSFLLLPLFLIMKNGLLQNVIFTSSSIIIGDSVVLDLKGIYKHQFIKLVNDNYVLEINSGERFQRFIVDQSAYENIAYLLLDLS